MMTLTRAMMVFSLYMISFISFVFFALAAGGVFIVEGDYTMIGLASSIFSMVLALIMDRPNV